MATSITHLTRAEFPVETRWVGEAYLSRAYRLSAATDWLDDPHRLGLYLFSPTMHPNGPGACYRFAFDNADTAFEFELRWS